jgi:hypothetical protein
VTEAIERSVGSRRVKAGPNVESRVSEFPGDFLERTVENGGTHLRQALAAHLSAISEAGVNIERSYRDTVSGLLP